MGTSWLARTPQFCDGRPMVGQLVMTFFVAAAAPAPDCPNPAAVVAELERLGTARAVAAVGAPEIRVHGERMGVALRGLDGVVSGVREVTAPASCAERAAVAAVLVSVWVGAWRVLSIPDATRLLGAESKAVDSPEVPTASSDETGGSQLAPSRATFQTPLSSTEARVGSAPLAPVPFVLATPASSSPRVRPPATRGSLPAPAAGTGLADQAVSAVRPVKRVLLEFGGFGFGVHDGDSGAPGGGIQGGLRFPRWPGIDAVISANGERQRAMVRGTAAYRLFGLALGPIIRKQLGLVFGDAGVLPEVTLLAVEGRNLSLGRSVTRWGVAIDARLRLGLVFGPWRPFVFAGANYALRAERLTLDDYLDQHVTLSRWNTGFGLGVAYLFEVLTKE